MEFKFENLGIIKEANIKLNGLTVLTGLNDTGKSFISKAIYSIAKTVNESNEQDIADRYEKTRLLINQIFSLHRSIVPFTPQRNQSFNPNEVSNKILQFLVADFPTETSTDEVKNYAQRVIDDIRDYFNEQQRIHLNIEPQISKILQISTDAQVALIDKSDSKKKFKHFFDNIIIQRLFQGQINNLNDKGNSLKILVTDGATEVLDIEIKDNLTKKFELKSIFLVTDATIIETPTIFQIAKFITTTLAFPNILKKAYQQRSDLPYTYYDLLEKLNIPANNTSIYTDIFNSLTKLIGGQLKFRLEDNSFILKKENGNEIKSYNIATGIKSLGLIQLLLSSGVIDKSALLIIDEPEVHLHPKWEIEYAKVICDLTKQGIKILISSHSPYLLRAIRKFSNENKDINTVTSFYFGNKKEDGFSYFEDVTENPEPIFKALAEPMMSLS